MTGDALRELDERYRNFNHASIEDVRVGPRREVTLIISPLVWRGSKGEDGPPVTVRFGGIEEFPRVAERFRELPSVDSEIGFLGADRGAKSRKAGRYRLRFEAERYDYAFTFRCSSVTITDAGEHQ